MTEAVERGEVMLAELPAVAEGGRLSPVLHEGMLEGLTLGLKTIRTVQAALDRDGENCDPKLLRLGNDTAMAICRLGMRAAEGEFKARHDDVLERFLHAVQAEKAMRGK